MRPCLCRNSHHISRGTKDTFAPSGWRNLKSKFPEVRECGKATQGIIIKSEIGVGTTVQADTESLDESKQTKFV